MQSSIPLLYQHFKRIGPNLTVVDYCSVHQISKVRTWKGKTNSSENCRSITFSGIQHPSIIFSLVLIPPKVSYTIQQLIDPNPFLISMVFHNCSIGSHIFTCKPYYPICNMIRRKWEPMVHLWKTIRENMEIYFVLILVIPYMIFHISICSILLSIAILIFLIYIYIYPMHIIIISQTSEKTDHPRSPSKRFQLCLTTVGGGWSGWKIRT